MGKIRQEDSFATQQEVMKGEKEEHIHQQL